MRYLVAAMLASTLLGSSARSQQPPIAETFLKVGQKAPDFTLLDNQWKRVRLSDYRGKTVILAFYVLAFTPG